MIHGQRDQSGLDLPALDGRGGRLSDRFGRKPLLVIGAAAVAVVSLPAFLLVTSGSFGSAVIGQLLLAAGAVHVRGRQLHLLRRTAPRRHPRHGCRHQYNLALAIFGGTAPFVGTWLVDITGTPVSPGYYLLAVALGALAVAVTAPETRVEEGIGAGSERSHA